jgi:hypothetical protein
MEDHTELKTLNFTDNYSDKTMHADGAKKNTQRCETTSTKEPEKANHEHKRKHAVTNETRQQSPRANR